MSYRRATHASHASHASHVCRASRPANRVAPTCPRETVARPADG